MILKKTNKALEKKVGQLVKQKSNILADHQKEVTALKKTVPEIEAHTIEKGWVKNVEKRGK